ncbi:unnamed protein product, partial [Didymodactylos carnosus]
IDHDYCTIYGQADSDIESDDGIKQYEENVEDDENDDGDTLLDDNFSREESDVEEEEDFEHDFSVNSVEQELQKNLSTNFPPAATKRSNTFVSSQTPPGLKRVKLSLNESLNMSNCQRELSSNHSRYLAAQPHRRYATFNALDDDLDE